MLRAPLLRTFLANLPIHRITGDLPPMVIVTALPLACRIAASSLSRLKLGWLKRTLAIAAEPFSHEPVLACRGARLQSTLPDVQASNLETDVEYVPRPRQWVCSFELQNRRKCCCFIPALTARRSNSSASPARLRSNAPRTAVNKSTAYRRGTVSLRTPSDRPSSPAPTSVCRRGGMFQEFVRRREQLRPPAFAADHQFQRFTHGDVIVHHEHDWKILRHG